MSETIGQTVADWQPIETAPRNERVLVWWPFWSTVSPVVAMLDTDVQHWRLIYVQLEQATWPTPTHWMPLPPPPATEGQ